MVDFDVVCVRVCVRVCGCVCGCVGVFAGVGAGGPLCGATVPQCVKKA